MKWSLGTLLSTMLICAGCLAPEPILIIQTQEIGAPSATIALATSVPIPTHHPSSPPATAAPGPTPTLQAIRMLFAPDEHSDRTDIYPRFAEALASDADRPVVYGIPEDELAAIGLLCSDEADVAWLSAPAYILAHQRCGAVARYRGLRYGWAYYRGQIMVQSDAARRARNLMPITSLAGLDAASIGYTEPQSASGYFFPKALLQAAGVTPSEEVFLAGDGQAVLAVYKGEVDAAASYWAPPAPDGSIGDARALIEDVYSDVGEVVKVLYLTDPIPNDPIVFRVDLGQELETRLMHALLSMAQTQDGRALLDDLYGLDGLVPSNDADYDAVREMGELLQVDFEQLLTGS